MPPKKTKGGGKKASKKSSNGGATTPKTKAGESAVTANKFTVFPKLAAELRLKIWKEACSVMRNVDIWVDIYEYDGPNSRTFQFRTQTKPPGVLGANKESRLEALKHYTLNFGIYIDDGEDFKDCVPIELPMIYMNLKLDRPCLMNFYELGTLEDGEHRSENIDQCEKIGFTSIAYNVWQDMEEDGWGGHVPRHFHYYEKLKEIVLFKEDVSMSKSKSKSKQGKGGVPVPLEFTPVVPAQDSSLNRCEESMRVLQEEDDIQIRACKLAREVLKK